MVARSAAADDEELAEPVDDELDDDDPVALFVVLLRAACVVLEPSAAELPVAALLWDVLDDASSAAPVGAVVSAAFTVDEDPAAVAGASVDATFSTTGASVPWVCAASVVAVTCPLTEMVRIAVVAPRDASDTALHVTVAEMAIGAVKFPVSEPDTERMVLSPSEVGVRSKVIVNFGYGGIVMGPGAFRVSWLPESVAVAPPGPDALMLVTSTPSGNAMTPEMLRPVPAAFPAVCPIAAKSRTRLYEPVSPTFRLPGPERGIGTSA